MKVNDFLDSKLENDVFDVLFLDSKGKIVSGSVDYSAEVEEVTYKKIAIIKTSQRINE